MHIILEKIEGVIYGDIILSPKDIERITCGELIDSTTRVDKNRCYLGVRLQGYWEKNYEEDEEIYKECDETS